MSSDELNYYRARAADERTLAASSTNPKVARIHEQMAELYDKLTALEARPTLHMVTPAQRRA